MAGPEISSVKAILLAVHLAGKADIPSLRTLIAKHLSKPLHRETVLRILLTHLPDTLESSTCVPLLKDLISGGFKADTDNLISTEAVEDLSEGEAQKKVRKLHLLPLRWPYAAEDDPADPFVTFLVLRALQIDSTGLIAELPDFLGPFLHLSPYLQTWTISTILPLVRFYYEYHPDSAASLSIPEFERLGDKAGVDLLLSKTGTDEGDDDPSVGRDLRGLVGPWMYGDTRWKRRKLRTKSDNLSQTVLPLDGSAAKNEDDNVASNEDDNAVTNEKCIAWEEVFRWVTEQSVKSWRTAVDAVEQWDGPGDADLGNYGDGTVWLDEGDQQYLERRYARAAIASAYLVPEESIEALEGVNRILIRIITLMDKDRIPTLQAAAALLSPVSGLEDIMSAKNAVHLRNDLLSEQNILTSPKDVSIKLLHALVVSAYLCTRAGHKLTTRKTGQLALLQNKRDQELHFQLLMHGVADGPKEDDKYWIRLRNEILWLRSWGSEELSEGASESGTTGKGIFGKLSKDHVEAELLRLFLKNDRFALAKSIYETSADPPLSKGILVKAVISAATNAYDNATNASSSRGGVKRSSDILNAFPDSLEDSLACEQMQYLTKVTNTIGKYRLFLKQGVPFKPVNLRVHGDPIQIIGKILELNPTTYAQISDFIDLGKNMIRAGLVVRDSAGRPKDLSEKEISEQNSIVDRRVTSMCIDAALAEDDFETAYSYVVTRLKNIAGPAHARTPDTVSNKSGLFAAVPPPVMDDWSWRAALQAGKYHRTENTKKPTHLGNASGNPEIRHREQRMDCLSHALRLAPKATLHEIVNVFRRCEEELEAHAREEAEEEAAWDAQGDKQAMPGGFAAPARKNTTIAASSRGAEESPMSLFDLSKASMARAQTGISALSMFRSSGNHDAQPQSLRSNDGSGTTEPAVGRSRKRDQLKNAAVGGLATGIGWLVGAQPILDDDHEGEKD